MKKFIFYFLIVAMIISASPVLAGQRTLTFEGKVSAQIIRRITVPFPIFVDELLVNIGDSVHKSQQLVRYHLHPRELRAFQGELYTGGGQADMQMQISALEQELLQSNAQKRTSAELAAKGLSSPSDAQRNSRQLGLLLQRKDAMLQKRESCVTDFNLRTSELETYFGHKLKKGDTLPRELFLTAPMDGTIIDISPQTRSQGLVDPNIPAVTMAVLDPIQIQIQVYESEVSRMRIGQEVSVEVVNMGGKKVKGKISMLSWMPVNATIGVPSFYFVYIDIENPDHMIRPGYKTLVHIDME